MITDVTDERERGRQKESKCVCVRERERERGAFDINEDVGTLKPYRNK